ncbi:MAG: hypothetical protein WCP98_11920 [Actinomycetes bacterium]
MRIITTIAAAAVVIGLALAAGACGGQSAASPSPSPTSTSAAVKGALPMYADVADDQAPIGADGSVPTTGALLTLDVMDGTFAAPNIDLAARNVSIQVESGAAADLSGAKLSQAKIYYTMINGSLDLRGADMSRLLIPDAQFSWDVGGTMDLRGANLTGADLTNLVGREWKAKQKWWGNITIDDTTVFNNTRMPKTGALYTRP